MIDCYVGKPRNGKSLLAIIKTVDVHLLASARDIVTNMVLFEDELQELCDELGGDFSVRHRLRFLTTKEEMKNFWLYRGRGLTLTRPPGYGDRNGGDQDIDYSPLFTDPRFVVGGQGALDSGKPVDLRGTLYVIDEIHTLFPARGWQGTPRHADFYCSQHAKLNDHCIFITQNTKLVDPNFLRLAQQFTYCRNHRLLKFGMFKGDNKFVAKTYENPAAGPNEITLNVETYKLDLRYARCYDTSAGVGMPGGGTADKGQRTKGVPLKMVWLGLAAVLALCVMFFNVVVPKLTSRYVAPALGSQIKAKADQVEREAMPAGVRQVDRLQGPVAGVPVKSESAGPVVVDRVTGRMGRLFSATWFDGWLPFDEAAGGNEARAQLLLRFADYRPEPRPKLAAN